MVVVVVVDVVVVEVVEVVGAEQEPGQKVVEAAVPSLRVTCSVTVSRS